MSERQKHGFNFEQYVKEKYQIILSNEYTSKWDGVLNTIPVSIKLEQYGSDIELADYFRNSQIEENFYLIVGFWQGTKDNIIEEYILLINGEEYHKLFDLSFNERFTELLVNISNDKKDDILWKQQITLLRKEWSKKTSNLIRPRFKRDHKKQKRIQCAINNKDFYNYFIPKYNTHIKEAN